MTAPQSEKLIQKAAEHLGEFFDAVVIIATRYDGDATLTTSRSVGNYHSRVNMAREYVIRSEADEQGAVYAKHLKPDEGDSWK